MFAFGWVDLARCVGGLLVCVFWLVWRSSGWLSRLIWFPGVLVLSLLLGYVLPMALLWRISVTAFLVNFWWLGCWRGISVFGRVCVWLDLRWVYGWLGLECDCVCFSI